MGSSRPGIEPVSLALAGGLLTTAPPGKSYFYVLNFLLLQYCRVALVFFLCGCLEVELLVQNICIFKNVGLPWWRTGWESACQCRGRGFEPWSGKIPHATEQLGQWATTTEPARLEPVLRNERPRRWEARALQWRVAPARRNLRKPWHRNEDPAQPKISK